MTAHGRRRGVLVAVLLLASAAVVLRQLAAPAAADALGRAMGYLGLALALGAAAWRWLVWPAPGATPQTAARALALGALLAALGSALLLDAMARSASVGVGTLVSSEPGGRLFLRVVVGTAATALAGLALLPGNRSRLGGPVATVLLVASAILSASAGHAAGEGLSGLLVDTMHLLASTTWVGGLALFFVALRRADREGWPADEVRRMGLRFGTVALACVLLLVLSGLATTFVVLGRSALVDPLHLTGSPYGRLLLTKVALAALMVGLAAANRFVFLDPARAEGLRGKLARLGPDGTLAALRRTLCVEAAFGVAALAVAGLLTATSPAGHDAGSHDHAGAAAAGDPAASLISPAGHGSAMTVPAFLAPLHEGHDGGSAFDAYNITIGLIVVALLVAVGFLLYKVAQRRRGD